MLHRATPRSLVVIDEFGKGTLTSDGVGLLAAMLQHFARAAPCPPRLLACTHFHELVRPEVMARCEQIDFFEMAVLVGEAAEEGAGGGQQGQAAVGQGPQAQRAQGQQQQHGQQERGGAASGDPDRPIFLYRLTPGHSAPSFGLHCARLCGVPAPILERASAIIDAQQRGGAAARLALPPLQERDKRYRDLVRRLAAVDLKTKEQVAALLSAAAASK